MYNIGPKTLTVGTGGVTADRLVKFSSGTVVHNTATSTDVPLGVAQATGAVGDAIAVRLMNQGGTVEISAAGAITQGAKVYAAANGQVQALPGSAGTYRAVGIALQAASGAGHKIEVYPFDWLETATV